jgi:hypothetical protein
MPHFSIGPAFCPIYRSTVVVVYLGWGHDIGQPQVVHYETQPLDKLAALVGGVDLSQTHKNFDSLSFLCSFSMQHHLPFER